MSRNQRIHQLLSKLEPVYLLVEDESSKHHVPQNAETHFKVVLISEQFTGLTRIARHRMINQLLAEELKAGLHALSLHLYTRAEWQKQEKTIVPSPACHDGYQHG